MKYIESKDNGDGTFDHTQVKEAYDRGSIVDYRFPVTWRECEPSWDGWLMYRAAVPDTYGIHESSSTLREGGPAVAEMLLDTIAERDNRIKELEALLGEARDTIEDILGYVVSTSSDVAVLDKIRAALNKED